MTCPATVAAEDSAVLSGVVVSVAKSPTMAEFRLEEAVVCAF